MTILDALRMSYNRPTRESMFIEEATVSKH